MRGRRGAYAFGASDKRASAVSGGSCSGDGGGIRFKCVFPAVNVGINPVTAAVTGFLGLPGVAALIVAGLLL